MDDLKDIVDDLNDSAFALSPKSSRTVGVCNFGLAAVGIALPETGFNQCATKEPMMARSYRDSKKRSARNRLFEILETRLLYAVHNDSFDVTDLTQLRTDSNYSSITGKGVDIAVLDTGVDAKNPDLTSKVQAYYNAVEDPIPSTISSSSVANAVDNDGHGTHTSGIAASADPNIGVAYGSGLVDVKVIADSGETQLSGDPLLRGLEFVAEYAAQFNIKVVSMSLGEATSSGGINDNAVPAADDISREIQTLEALGITVVAAAGNSYANDPVPGESYPAVVSTISVASTWADTGSGYDFNTYAYGTSEDTWAATESSAAPDQFSATSQRSTLPNQVVAPGVNIYSDWNGTSTDNSGTDLLHNTLSGTSMATPFVAGLVALMQQAAYTYGGQYITDPQEVLNIIKQTSDVIQDPNVAGDTRVPISNGQLTGGASQALDGTGDSYDRVNVYKAIQAVQALFSGTISNADTNNTIATATSVPALDGTADYTESGVIGSDGLNDVGANDVDLYEVTLSETGTLSAILADTNGGTAFTADVRLFNSSGGQLTIATGTSASGYPTLTTANPLAVGTYYIGVSSAGNAAYNISDGSGATGGNTTGDYSLTLSISNPDPNGVPQGAVAVDLTDPNYSSNSGVVSNYYNGTLGSDPAPTGSTTRVSVPNGDVDMFKVVAPDTGTLTALADVSAYPGTGADTYVEVLDSNLNVIASNGQQSNFPSSSQVQFNVTVGDTYYVAVTVYANRNFSPADPYTRVEGSTQTQTQYDMYLTFNNGNTNGTALLATPGTIGATVTGTISSSNPLLGSNGGSKYVNWYTYSNNTNSDALLDLTATGTTTGFSPNIQYWTLASSGTSITQVGGITGSGQSLIYEVSAGQTIYVSVTGAGNSNFNWYSLGSGSGGDTGSYSLTSSLLPTSSLKTLNDSSIDYGTPQTITVGQAVSGNLGMYRGLIVGDTDVDLYKFVPTTSGAYDINTNTSQEGSADTYLRLFDASGNQLASNDNASDATTASFIRADLVAGQTYYIGVSGTGNSAYSAVTGGGTAAGATGNYTLSVALASIPAITVSSPAPVSPSTGGTSIDFVVSLDFASTATVTVDYATVDGTAVAGADYTSTSGTLVFAPGQTSQTVSVPILINPDASGTTTFTLGLSSVSSNAEIDGGEGTGTISNLAVTQLDFSAKQHAVYEDSNGRKVTVSLTGPGSGVVSVVGASALVDIAVTGSTKATHLNIITATAVNSNVSGIAITGSLATLNAPRVELTGDLTVSGTIALLAIAGATGNNTLSIQGTGTAGTLELGNISDLTVNTSEPLKALTDTAWQNLSTADVITAPYIQLLSSKGDFGAGLVVGSGGAALETARIGGAINQGTWKIDGTINSIVAGSTALAWTADVQGAITTWQVNGTAGGNVTAAAIRNVHVKDDFTATLNLTSDGTGRNPSLDVFSVGGTINQATIRSVGDIDSIHTGAIDGSTIFAGVSSTVTGVPTSTADFSNSSEILSFVVTGVKGSTFAVTTSEIAAAEIGKVYVARVDITAGDTDTAIVAETLASFTEVQPKSAVLAWNSKKPTSELTTEGDLTVNLLQ
jgi:subtilisin family serine protease